MSHHNFLKSPLGPEMNRCRTEITIDFNIIGAASDLRKIFEHFPPENQPWMRHVFWHWIQRLMNATTSLMGHGVLLGITPTLHPILQHVARNAAAMEADGFNIDDIPPFEWDLTDLTFHAIVAAPSDAWWEDLDVLREDPDPMNWEYIPNIKGNNQFWEALKEYSEEAAGQNIPSQLLSRLLHNIHNSIARSINTLGDDINTIQADIEVTTRSLSRLLSRAPEDSMATLAEIRSRLGQGEDRFWARRFEEMDTIIAKGSVADV
ncbi:hypothetical protein PAXINDRAFT_18133 [Paxillus involutus ATCC 200175]|uniref:Uncharacterized protein n=1 Tax=Paxillus involutus ATCC 200175 TaxID=664439 RepID=A0A0C9TNF1_PAXIN|nr:hypothetical protein PAXINDRAFT_18133 [Paxillus involutus ATCC 200175]